MKYLSEGYYEEAIVAFTEVIEIDPKQALPYSGRGQAYVLAGETAENLAAALADFEAALALDETLAEAWLGLADVYIRQGDYDKALEVLKEGLEKTGNDPSIAGKLAEIESGTITDSSGRMRRENSYDGDGNLIWYRIYGYPEGKTYEITSYDAAGNQTGYAYSEHDGNGNQIAMISMNQDSGEVSQTLREFDDNGNCVKSTEYTAAGEIDCWWIYAYDAAGNEIRAESFWADGTSRGYDLYEYDASGNRIKESSFSGDGTLIRYEVVEYNEYETIYYEYNGDGALSVKTVYMYNEKREQIGMERYVYDSEGNVIQFTVNE